MKKAIFITREVDGSFTATPCNDYRDLDQEKVKRVIWQDYFINDLLELDKKSDNKDFREGLRKALELYNKNKNILPAMFITTDELKTMTLSLENDKTKTLGGEE